MFYKDSKIKKQDKEEKDELHLDYWRIAVDLACGGMQRQLPTYSIKEDKQKNKEIRMFKELSAVDMFVKFQSFLDLRELDIEEIRDMGKESHDEFSEWITMDDREEMLKECLSRLMYAA